MKYLKIYEAFDRAGLKHDDSMFWFGDKINWELVDDAKEMSLEYLDIGYDLAIDIKWRPESSWSLYDVYSIYYSHDTSLIYEHNYKLSGDDNFSIGKIMYKIRLLSPDKKLATTKLHEVNYNGELVTRLKGVYSEERIYFQ